MLRRLIRGLGGSGLRGGTRGVLENAEPRDWRKHLFGLSPQRWARLNGKAFWITGAGTGYGRSLACALAAAGGTVFLTGRRIAKLEESLQELERVFRVSPANCHLVPADITKQKDLEEACNSVMRRCSSLCGLVNNAAMPSTPGCAWPLRECSAEDWHRMMDTNVRAPWLLTRGIFAHLLHGAEIRVLFITSEAGWSGTPGFGIYNVSKAALNSLAFSLAQEYAAANPGADIQMNVVSPGQARTEMNRGSSVSPYSIVSIALILLSHPSGGPNGRFFYRDGRPLEFCDSTAYPYKLL